ncbi:DUF559 domain-containing protein [bacterium]|nr:DUF559 domain-containing protein [bacterium]
MEESKGFNKEKMKNEISVLVAVLRTKKDFEILKKEGWYRIPRKHAPEYFDSDFIAFYFSNDFGKEKFTIRYFAQVLGYEVKKRIELIPDEPEHANANEDYYKINVAPLIELPRPIKSRLGRYIVFIPSTLKRLMNAVEVNELYRGSHIEEKLWAALRKAKIQTEREMVVNVDGNFFMLDFACLCKGGKIDIECDGREFHSDYPDVEYDKDRNNLLTKDGWQVLRFTSAKINDKLDECVSVIRETVAKYGGVEK